MSHRPILVMAGGTGGHVFPGLAVAEILRAREQGVVWLGTHRGLESKLVPARGIDIEWISKIARVLDIPAGTARSRLYRALQSMRATIDADERAAVPGVEIDVGLDVPEVGGGFGPRRFSIYRSLP